MTYLCIVTLFDSEESAMLSSSLFLYSMNTGIPGLQVVWSLKS